MTRKDKIQAALASVYSHGKSGKGTMVESCATYIDSKWDDFLVEAKKWEEFGSTSRDMQYQIHMQIWNWFPGGGTAEIAADKVMEAVNED